MTPDLSYTTTGRDGESGARKINETEKKIDKKSRTAFQTNYTNKQSQQYSGGIPIQDHPVTSRSRRSLLLSVVGNIWPLVCARHGDLIALMSRMALSLTLWVPFVWIHLEVERFG